MPGVLAAIGALIQGKLDPVERKHFDRLAGASRPPAVLYHYTTAAGLLGIVESNRIWASDMLFMNDSTEVEYGRQLILQAAAEAVAIATCALAERVFRTIEALLFPIEMLGGGFHAACFCEQGDLLSQWRGYSGGIGGYSVGFNTDRLAGRRDDPVPERRFVLRRVIYDPAEQRKLIRDFFVDVNGVLTELMAGELADVEQQLEGLASLMVQNLMLEYMLTMKNEAFEGEREWRLIHRRSGRAGSDRARLRFRPERSFPVPYVALDPTPLPPAAIGGLPGKQRDQAAGRNRVPISRIVVGPTPHPVAAALAIRHLVIDFEPGVDVVNSAIPIRA